MIKFRNHIGTIGISTGYLRQLISDTAESCFGVAGLNVYGAKQGVSAMLKKENTTKGLFTVLYTTGSIDARTYFEHNVSDSDFFLG